ncbi:MAG TPA: hypothetical protein VG738_04605 [Chitinophagaceae bacterium]|nr:hypothetical protein [Chitinophagaceae bacterium]
MKKIRIKAKGSAMPVMMVALITMAVVLFACSKNAGVATVGKTTGINDIAKTVDGDMLQGSIAMATDENYLDIVFNSGSRYILLQKIPGMLYENTDEIKKATLVTSKYGVILKDDETGKIWLFANNDDESLQKFESLKQQLHTSYVSATVFGSTIVKQEL